MAVIGYLGRDAEHGIHFTMSREVFRTPSNLTWGGSARYSTHDRHATHALTEFTGLDPDNFSFDILLTAELGVDPMEELTKIWTYERDGEALGLVIGAHAYGKYRWTIQKHETKVQYTDRNGDLYCIEVSVNLLEYLNMEVSNTSGLSQTAMQPSNTVGADTGGTRTYTVKKGDCLWTIAKKFYNSGAQWKKIYEANRSVIGSNPNLIYEGQVLIIP